MLFARCVFAASFSYAGNEGTECSRTALKKACAVMGVSMSLPDGFADVMMMLACRTCGIAITKKGSWFKSASRYKCESCGVQGRVTYDDKMRLFARAATEGQRIRQKG